MCGRYEFSDYDDIEELRAVMRDIDSKYNNVKAYKTEEIFPTNSAIVYTKSSIKQFEPCVMKWGFTKWDNKGSIINAKSETAHEKKMFSGALAYRRCVIPSTGFFEWKPLEGSKAKQKYHFTAVGNNPILYMAGLYNLEKPQESPSFVILTTQANRYISDIHNRMPVILYKNEIFDWLNDSSFTSTIFSRTNTELARKEA